VSLAASALLDTVLAAGPDAAAASAPAASDSARDAGLPTPSVDRVIAAIDALVSAQVDAILHHPRLRRLEGAWRGVAWLLQGIDANAPVRVRLLNLPWSELCRDLERAAEFDQSQLFRKVYEEEFGSPGGEPFGLLVVDHEVRHRPGPKAPTDDIGALADLASIAAAAFVPTIVAASPALLQVDGFADLAHAGDLTDPFRASEYVRWRGLSGREDMRFIGVVLPRLLARAPWADDPARPDGFCYAEYAPGADERVWMSAGFGFAAAAARAFANHSWPADVRGSETDRLGGGLLTDLPDEPFASDPHWFRPSLEIALTDRQERALADAALMPLSVLPFGQQAVFASVRSLQTPQRYAGPNATAATANARLSSQINAMLCVSRFAHCIKLRGRDLVGSFRTAEEIERSLHDWLQAYVNANTASTGDSRARHPLVAADISVREQPGRPGVFGCTALLQPHFQLDDVSATFRLVTDIAAPGMR
jgi:type VI secretion system ImpC/EvpB family protein